VLLGDSNAKMGRDIFFKPTIGNDSLHQDTNDKGVRIVNPTTPKNLVVKSTIFPHRNIYRDAWSSPNGKTHKQIEQILIEKRWLSNILHVRSCRGADCNTDHYLVVAKVRERLTVSKQAAQNFDGEKFNLRKLNGLEVRKPYQIEIINRFAALGNLSDWKDINRAWENIKENIITSAKKSLVLYELKHHKPWLDEECLRTVRSKEAGWLQNPNQSNVGNQNNIKREACRHFRGENMVYMKAKIH